MKKIKYLIIGAGISGLSFARQVKNDYLIIEKENEIGGYCKTIRKKDFIWDYAGHFFHFNDKYIKKDFMNLMGENKIIFQEKNTKILYKNKLINYPFQTNIHELPKKDFINCLYDLYFRNKKEEFNNFLEMLYAKFGVTIVDIFLKPYNEKLYACDLKYLDKDAMGRFFPDADLDKIIGNMRQQKDSSYNNTFLYPKEGVGAFLDVLYNSLDSSKIKLKTEVLEINPKEKYIVTNKKEKIYYDYLINTSPLNNFLEIYNNFEYEKLQKKLSYNKVLVFNLGFNKKSKLKQHWIYIPKKETNYYRIGFYDNILNSDKLSMYIEIGYSKDAIITQKEIDRQLKLTLENLLLDKVIDSKTKLEEYVAIVMDPAYVHINNDTEIEISNLMKTLNKINVYSIGRYGAWTYCSMEDCILRAKNLAKHLESTQ